MLQGHQSWVFENKPVIIGSAAIGGPFEAKGNLASDFDYSTMIYGWDRTVMKRRKESYWNRLVKPL
jgi:stage V sporulation protein AD